MSTTFTRPCATSLQLQATKSLIRFLIFIGSVITRSYGANVITHHHCSAIEGEAYFNRSCCTHFD